MRVRHVVTGLLVVGLLALSACRSGTSGAGSSPDSGSDAEKADLAFTATTTPGRRGEDE